MKKILFIVLSVVTGFASAMDQQAQQNVQQQQTPALTAAQLQAVRDQLSQRYANALQEGRTDRDDAKRTGRIAKSRALRPGASQNRLF